jgi:hypothetical protein
MLKGKKKASSGEVAGGHFLRVRTENLVDCGTLEGNTLKEPQTLRENACVSVDGNTGQDRI